MGVIIAYICLLVMCFTVLAGSSFILYLNFKEDREETEKLN